MSYPRHNFADRTNLIDDNDSVLYDTQIGVQFRKRVNLDVEGNAAASYGTQATEVMRSPPTTPEQNRFQQPIIQRERYQPPPFEQMKSMATLARQRSIASKSLPSPQESSTSMSTMTNLIKLKYPPPPRDMPTSQFSKHLPENKSDPFKTRLLLAWAIQRELDSETEEYLNSLDSEIRQAKRDTRDTKQKFRDQLLDGTISATTLLRPATTEFRDLHSKKQNEKNIRNEERLKYLERLRLGLNKESDEWKKYSEDIYAIHAASDDKAPKTEEELTEPYEETHLHYLDPAQREFMDQFLYEEENESTAYLRQSMLDLESNITQIRSNLNVVNQFAIKSRQFADRVASHLAAKVAENTNIIPVEEPIVPGLFSIDPDQRKQSENKNAYKILRLLAANKVKQLS